MGRNVISPYINDKIVVSIDKYGLLSEDEFNSINNLYHFKKNKDVYYDYKRNKTVATKIKSILEDKFMYNFNLSWLKTEIYSTNSTTLLDIVKNNSLLHNIYEGYLAKKKTEKHYEALDAMTKELPDEEGFTEDI